MQTLTVEEIVKELCAQEPDFVGHEDEVRALVLALKEVEPAGTLDPVFVSELREKLLTQGTQSPKPIPSPYIPDWTAWIVRLAPVGVMALLLMVVLDGAQMPAGSPSSSHSKNFVYPPAASHSNTPDPSVSRLGADGTVIAQPVREPAYGGSADMFTAKEMVSEPMVEIAPQDIVGATSSPSGEGEMTADPIQATEEPVPLFKSSAPNY